MSCESCERKLPDPLLLDVQSVAALLGVSDRTVWSHSQTGHLPKPVRIGKRCLWRRGELETWIESGCKPVSMTRTRVIR